MEDKSILKKIKSKELFNELFEFIKDPNFKLKLFVHSKSFQKKLDLDLVDYEKTYIDQFGIDLNNYLFCENNIFPSKFEKDILKNNLENDIKEKKLDINMLKKIIVDVYSKKYEKQYQGSKKDNSNSNDCNGLIETEVPIEIFSPFIDILSETEAFEKMFTISLSMYIIEKFDLKDEYISMFEKLNNSKKSKYSSLNIYYEDSYDILDLKEFKINFNQIKRINFIPNSFHVTGDFKYFLSTFFSFFYGKENNLTNLRLKWHENEIEPKLIKNVNNFKSLRLLNLTGFKFTETFILKLCNLEKLTLDTCENVKLVEDSCLNIRKLIISNSSINKSESLLKIPKLEECEMTYLDKTDLKFNSIFDFSTITKIKKFIGDPCDFVHIDNNALKYIKLISYSEVPSDLRRKVYEKLVHIKTLKEIVFEFGKIDNNEIFNIIGRNTSTKKLTINWVKSNIDLTLYNLQDKFPNISRFEIHTPKFENNSKINFEITENKYCKISKLFLEAGIYNDMKFYCLPFENLVEIKLTINNRVVNLKDSIPIFNKNCNVVFTSMNVFHFKTITEHVMNLYILENLYNNIDKMPNLSDLLIDCRIQENIDEDFYLNFFKKCLGMNLKRIFFSIKGSIYPKEESYSKEELEKICPGVNFSKFKAIYIRKLKKF